MDKLVNFVLRDELYHQVLEIGKQHGHVHASSGEVNLSATIRYLIRQGFETEQLRADLARLRMRAASRAGNMPG